MVIMVFVLAGLVTGAVLMTRYDGWGIQLCRDGDGMIWGRVCIVDAIGIDRLVGGCGRGGNEV